MLALDTYKYCYSLTVYENIIQMIKIENLERVELLFDPKFPRFHKIIYFEYHTNSFNGLTIEISLTSH